MRNPTVSVVLPVRDAAATLSTAVQSVRAQTFSDWELILFDDGSSDDSPAIARACAADDSRIRVIASSHVGIVEALHRACAEARGGLIARMDADDTALPQRLAKQVALMAAQPDVALCGTQVTMVGSNIGSGRQRYESWINELLTHEAMVRELFVECPLPHPTFMMRRDAFEEVGGYQDRGWAEDYDLCMRFFLAGMRFGKMPEPLLEWHDAPARLSTVDPRYRPEAFRALKRHYLFKTYLKDAQTFYQWGAGEVGKPWLREWGRGKPQAVVDINPRKFGHVIHGALVIPPEQLPSPGEAFIVIAVGAPGARQQIRDWLEPRNYCETADFLFLA